MLKSGFQLKKNISPQEIDLIDLNCKIENFFYNLLLIYFFEVLTQYFTEIGVISSGNLALVSGEEKNKEKQIDFFLDLLEIIYFSLPQTQPQLKYFFNF